MGPAAREAAGPGGTGRKVRAGVASVDQRDRARPGHRFIRLPLTGWPVEPAEGGETVTTRSGLTVRLADDPRVDAAAVLDLDRCAVRPILEHDAGAVAVIRQPV